MIAKRLSAALALATFLGVLTLAAPAQAISFGSSPLDLAISAAGSSSNTCSSRLPKNKLAALMLSVPLWEVAGGSSTATPSPMTLGRADNGNNLYYANNPTGPYRRAFWHPGIGMWQLDDSGMGSRASFGKFDASNSASVVATNLSSRYCSNSSFSYVFAPWYACQSSRCANTFGTIYNGSTNTIRNVSRDTSVGSYGGSSPRSCRFAGQTTNFTCYYVNYNNAQGYTGSWVYNINGTPPLSKPFYVFRQDVNGTSYEWRVFLAVDSGYGQSLGGRRAYGTNSRNGLYWTSSVYMCDVSANRCT